MEKGETLQPLESGKVVPILRKERVVCALCQGDHPTKECEKLKNVSEQSNFERIKGVVAFSGVGKFGEEGIQAIFSQLSNDSSKRDEIVDLLVKFYNLGKNDKDGLFEGSIMTGKASNNGIEKIKIDKKPIGYDKDSDQYVLRCRMVSEDGKIDPVVRANKLTTMELLSNDVEEKVEEIMKKISNL